MKTKFNFLLISAIAGIFCCCSCKVAAQAAGSYINNHTMSAFHGNWQWTSGADTVKITFGTYPVAYNINGGFMWDHLVGWYYYKSGNNIICSNYNSIGNTTIESLVKGGNEHNSPNKVEAYFKDPLKDKTNKVTLVLNSAQNQISWRASEIGLIRASGPLSSPGMTLPKHMTLIKL